MQRPRKEEWYHLSESRTKAARKARTQEFKKEGRRGHHQSGPRAERCPVPSQEHPQVLSTLIQSQTLHGVGGGEGQSPLSLAPQSLMQPAVASNSWVHTPGCTVPRPLPGLGSWGGEGRSGPRQVPGRAVWQLMRLGGGRGRRREA